MATENKIQMNDREIILNGIPVKYGKITTTEMVEYIKNEHPEEKKRFATLVYAKANKTYNHFRARKIFCEMFFPEIFNETIKEPNVSDEIKSWLEEPSDIDIVKKTINTEKVTEESINNRV